MQGSKTYSIVIPVYNSSRSLTEICDRLSDVFQAQVQDSYEVIFVDDGSTNPITWETLERLAQREGVTAIRLTRNFGKAGAVLCGFKEAQGDYIITMDDDLQHAPEDIPKLLEQKSHDVVLGNFKNKQHSLFKRLTSGIKSWFDYKLIGKPKHITNSPFKVYKRAIVDAMLEIRSPHPFIAALLYFVTKDVVMVDVEHHKRPHDKSGFTSKRRFKSFTNLLFNNSSFLLRVIAGCGIFIAMISFLLGGYFIFKKIQYDVNVAGWTSLMVVTLFLGGLILFSIGVVGEYLVRIINTNENKPPYIIREKRLE